MNLNEVRRAPLASIPARARALASRLQQAIDSPAMATSVERLATSYAYDGAELQFREDIQAAINFLQRIECAGALEIMDDFIRLRARDQEAAEQHMTRRVAEALGREALACGMFETALYRTTDKPRAAELRAECLFFKRKDPTT